MDKRVRRICVYLGLLTSMSVCGCNTALHPLTLQELQTTAKDRAVRMMGSDQEPVTGPIGLDEAIARAIKYNLDHQVEISNVWLKHSSKQLEDIDMLPNLIASSSLSRRNKDPGGYSINSTTGVRSANASRSVERQTWDSDLTLSWDILDYGLSYYRSKQSGNDILIALEQRRATINRLVQSVRTAYWQAVSYDQLKDRIVALGRKANQALAESRALTNGGFSSPKPGLIYQRDLLRIIGEMSALQQNLEISKHQLGALINLEPGAKFSVHVPERKMTQKVNMPVSELVELAYLNRPELREITYEQRNALLEEKSAALQLLPSIRPFLTQSISSNSLLLDNQWLTAGTRISWDLINVFSHPYRIAAIRSQQEILDARALALTHAVATQVHVAYALCKILHSETQNAAEYAEVSRKILATNSSESSVGLVGMQEEVYEEMSAIIAEMSFNERYAALQSAYANLFVAIGENDYPAELNGEESLNEMISSTYSYQNLQIINAP